MKKIVDPVTLEIKQVEKLPEKKDYVYVIIDEGNWDYETSCDVEIYKDFHTALKVFKEKTKTAHAEMKEWLEEDDIKLDSSINEQNESALFEIYQDGDFTRFHNTITLEKREVQ